MRRTVRAVSAKENAHADHATKEAVRPLILPIPRSTFLASSVTTLYRKIDCRVLQKQRRGKFCASRRAEPSKIHY
jgi:hypothetical protein